MSYGAMSKSSDGVPLGAVVKPGNTTPLPIQGSALSQIDSNTNTLTGIVSSDARIEAVLSGQAYSVAYGQTIGGAAQGQYCLSVFNQVGSGKNVLITSVKTMVNYTLTTTWLYLNTSDPAYSANLSSSILNLKGGGGASILGSHVTANSASVSFPGSGEIEQSISAPELISNGMPFYLVPGNGFNALVFVGNSQQYAISVKWIEFLI